MTDRLCEKCSRPRDQIVLCWDALKFICSACSRACSCSECRKYRAERTTEGFRTDGKKKVFCPHCGSLNQDDYDSDFWGEAHKGDSFDLECQSCEKKFTVEPHITITFSTYSEES